jgi:hypothetical protein
LTKEMADGKSYIELVEFLNRRASFHMSIVANSISSAIQGEFGNFHPTSRTKDSEQFISPLMGMLWFFTLESIASRIGFADRIMNSETMDEVAKGFQLFRAMNSRRPRKKIPL